MVDAFGDTGAFCWYATWNLIGWVFCYFLLPETKNLTLEELDNIFSVRNRDHAKYYLDAFPYYIKKYLLFQDVAPMTPLYHFDQTPEHEKSYEVPQASAQHNEGVLTDK